VAVFCVQAYADYDDMINLTEELICELAMEVCGTLDISYQVRARPRRSPNSTLHAAVRLAAHGAARAQGVDISLQRPWRRAPMHELVKEATGVDFYAMRADLEGARCAFPRS
jgi:lysyl-tRNA synthetase class 2